MCSPSPRGSRRPNPTTCGLGPGFFNGARFEARPHGSLCPDSPRFCGRGCSWHPDTAAPSCLRNPRRGRAQCASRRGPGARHPVPPSPPHQAEEGASPRPCPAPALRPAPRAPAPPPAALGGPRCARVSLGRGRGASQGLENREPSCPTWKSQAGSFLGLLGTAWPLHHPTRGPTQLSHTGSERDPLWKGAPGRARTRPKPGRSVGLRQRGQASPPDLSLSEGA